MKIKKIVMISLAVSTLCSCGNNSDKINEQTDTIDKNNEVMSVPEINNHSVNGGTIMAGNIEDSTEQEYESIKLKDPYNKVGSIVEQPDVWEEQYTVFMNNVDTDWDVSDSKDKFAYDVSQWLNNIYESGLAIICNSNISENTYNKTYKKMMLAYESLEMYSGKMEYYYAEDEELLSKWRELIGELQKAYDVAERLTSYSSLKSEVNKFDLLKANEIELDIKKVFVTDSLTYNPYPVVTTAPVIVTEPVVSDTEVVIEDTTGLEDTTDGIEVENDIDNETNEIE